MSRSKFSTRKRLALGLVLLLAPYLFKGLSGALLADFGIALLISVVFYNSWVENLIKPKQKMSSEKYLEHRLDYFFSDSANQTSQAVHKHIIEISPLFREISAHEFLGEMRALQLELFGLAWSRNVIRRLTYDYEIKRIGDVRAKSLENKVSAYNQSIPEYAHQGINNFQGFANVMIFGLLPNIDVSSNETLEMVKFLQGEFSGLYQEMVKDIKLYSFR